MLKKKVIKNGRFKIIGKIRNSVFKEDLNYFFTVVKRGCAHKDKRYESTGCEEQLTGKGNFWLTLCLCKDSYCNSASYNRGKDTWLLVSIGFAFYNSKKILQL